MLTKTALWSCRRRWKLDTQTRELRVSVCRDVDHAGVFFSRYPADVGEVRGQRRTQRPAQVILTF